MINELKQEKRTLKACLDSKIKEIEDLQQELAIVKRERNESIFQIQQLSQNSNNESSMKVFDLLC